jgi:DNA topoisomerase-1
VLEIGMNRAVALLAEAKSTGRGRAAKPMRVIGPHPGDAAPIELYEGRYGMYVKHGGINATVPRDLKPEELTVEQAVSLLAERAAKGAARSPRPAAPRRRRRPPPTISATRPRPQGRQKKKAAPKRKAKADAPPRTGTDG